MRLRTYTVSQKYVKNKHGDIGFYKKRIKKWIKSSQPYKPRKRGLQKLSVHSTRFGFLDLYNRKEQQELICPSGYSISQCFNVLRKLWYAYRRAIGTDKDIDKMKKYAKAIQDVQKDMGIKTASFPHLRIYGDALILNAKCGMRRLFENHSAREKQQKPNTLNGEAIVTLVDDVSPYKKRDNKITVPLLLEPEDEKEEILGLIDNVPFQRQRRGPRKSKGISPLDYVPLRRRRRGQVNSDGEDESSLTNSDDVSPYEKQDSEITVPLLLEPEDEKEEILSLIDNVPFQRQRRGPRKSKGISPLDYVPLRRRRRGQVNSDGEDESTLTNADDEISNEIDTEIEDTDRASNTLEPEGDEEILVLSDDIPFRS